MFECVLYVLMLILKNILFQVTDFGLSVQKGGVGSENMLQATCGTPIYMGNSYIQTHTFTCSIYS